ncbi:MAG: hypothetical protein ACOYXT_22185 [Bacteroidota bacterium]
MKYFSIIFCIFIHFQVFSQSAADALKSGKESLQERYLLMKTKSQTYQDYKVIKEHILDGMWNVVRDTLAAKQAAIQQARVSAAKLKEELDNTTAALKAKESSMAETVYASTHITVLGIDFKKNVFINTFAIIMIVLLAFVGLMVARVKVVHRSLKDREDVFNTLSAEYEDYKRKAMDKQTKLSRELQNERNKLQGRSV